MPKGKGYGKATKTPNGAKVKGGQDSWSGRRKGKGHKATSVPQAGQKGFAGAKVSKGYATC